LAAFGLVIGAILTGGGLDLFINVPSMLIVMGGTFGIIFINFPLKEVLGVASVVKNAFLTKIIALDHTITQLVDFSGKARKEGILALEAASQEVEDDFLKKGMQLAVDGLEPQTIETLLEREIEHIENRHKRGAEILQALGTFSPAMGLVGTLIGLVQMLQSMDDPSSIGPAMAIALLTTFYGAILANVLFLPLAGKLRNRSQEELLSKEMMLEGILSIASGDNPRILESKLHAFIAPKLRKSSFQG